MLLTIISCKQKETKKEKSAQEIIDLAIERACSGNCNNAIISFNFRKNAYQAVRSNGAFQYTRIVKDSLVTITDVLSNTGLQRYMDEHEVEVADSLVRRISDGVNSVFYFAQLPFGLNDAAVIKQLLDNVTINDKPYYTVKVTFKEEGGGTDFDDQFIYWIHKNNYSVDYLAYSYEVNGGGVRFREAYNPRVVQGIRFVDYRNFKPENKEVSLTALPSLYEKKQLKLLSTIETENVFVTLFPKND